MKHKDPAPPPSQASLVAHMAKNLPAMQETRVQSLGQEDPLKKEMTTHSNILAWENPSDKGDCQAPIHGITELDMTQ